MEEKITTSKLRKILNIITKDKVSLKNIKHSISGSGRNYSL